MQFGSKQPTRCLRCPTIINVFSSSITKAKDCHIPTIPLNGINRGIELRLANPAYQEHTVDTYSTIDLVESCMIGYSVPVIRLSMNEGWCWLPEHAARVIEFGDHSLFL